MNPDIKKQKEKYVGTSPVIHDAKEKATGKIPYVGDMKRAGMLYARLVLSNVAHGKILRINTQKAEALPGVVKIYTAQNTPNTLYNSHQWNSGLDVSKDERLFSEKARFVGDRIAAVVATDPYTAKRAAQMVEIEYEPLEPILTIEDALDSEKPPIHENSSNHVMHKKMQVGSLEALDENEYITIESEMETPKVHHAAMEPHVCLAEADYSGHVTIWTPCQVIFQVQLITAQAVGLPLAKVRVIKAPMGGSFGGKGQPILEPVCAYMAHDLRKPIRLETDRRESILASRSRHRIKGKTKTIVSQEGKIKGREIDLVVDSGAYLTNGEALFMAMAKKANRLYRIPHQTVSGDVVYTNTPIGGACRGYGSPQIHGITEVNIDKTAAAIGWDPVDFRIKNLIHPFDEDPTGGPNLGNARVLDCVRKGAEKFNWYQRRQQVEENQSERYSRGVGMACATHGNGYYGAYQDFITLDMRMTEDGDLILKSGIHDLGCGTVTIMKQIVAEVMDLPLEKIEAMEGDTLVSPYDSAGTQASRVTYVCGAGAKKIAELLKDKMVDSAACIFDVDSGRIALRNGNVMIKDEDKVLTSCGELVMKMKEIQKKDAQIVYTYESPANPGVYGAHFVEVEIDRLTGLMKVLDVLAVHDIGKAINPGFVEGQIHGAVQMGIGLAVSEDLKIDENGQVKGDNFSRYHVVNAPDMPLIEVILIEDGDEHGPYGAKSIGEVATVPVTPAIINAVYHALGVEITKLPAIPERIIEAIKHKEEGE